MANSIQGMLHFFRGSIVNALLYPIFGVIVLINILVMLWEISYINKLHHMSIEQRKQDLVTHVQQMLNAFENAPHIGTNSILSNITAHSMAQQIIIFNSQGIAVAGSHEDTLNQSITTLLPEAAISVIHQGYDWSDLSQAPASSTPTSTTSLPLNKTVVRTITGYYATANISDTVPEQQRFRDNQGLIYASFDVEIGQFINPVFLRFEILFLAGKVLLLMCIIYLLVQKQIHSPIKTLLHACRHAVRTGSFELRKTLPSNEFNQLAARFQWVMSSLRENQAELDHAKTKLEAIFRSVQESILTIDTKGIVQSANSAVLPAFGYHTDELINHSLQLLFPHQPVTDDPNTVTSNNSAESNLIEQIINAPHLINFGKVHSLEGQKRNGRRFPILLTMSPGEANGERFYTLFIQNLTEQSNIKRKLAENQALFKAAVNSSLLGFALQKTDGMIIEVNPAMCTFLGYSKQALTGISLCSLINPTSLQNAKDNWERLKKDEIKDFSCDCLFTHRNGDEVWSILSSTKVHLPLTDEEFVVTQVVDITKEKNLSMRIAQRNIELKRSNDDLYNFAHSASHDLKSPLNAIGNIAGWIEDDCGDILPEASKKHLSILQSRCDRMKKLLDDLLGYSRLGQLDFSEQTINIGTMAKEIFELQENAHHFQFKAANTTLVLPRVPIEIILRNLISNAIRHHDQTSGFIEVTCQKRNEYYCLSVFDDGPGIPSELYEKAMEMFQTLRPRDEVEGSGIGLAMITKLLEHFHGRLEIHENTPKGTEVRVMWLINWKQFDANQH